MRASVFQLYVNVTHAAPSEPSYAFAQQFIFHFTSGIWFWLVDAAACMCQHNTQTTPADIIIILFSNLLAFGGRQDQRKEAKSALALQATVFKLQ